MRDRESETTRLECERESNSAGGGRRCQFARCVCVSCELIVSLEWMRIRDRDTTGDRDKASSAKMRSKISNTFFSLSTMACKAA